jgi:large subunit ribosomal protein L10
LDVDDSLFRETTALLFSNEDELAPFKLFVEQVKKYGVLQAKGGILEGRWISAKEVDAIAKLPGRQELYAQLVGVVSSPMRGLVTVLSGPYRNLVYVLQAIKEKAA